MAWQEGFPCQLCGCTPVVAGSTFALSLAGLSCFSGLTASVFEQYLSEPVLRTG